MAGSPHGERAPRWTGDRWAAATLFTAVLLAACSTVTLPHDPAIVGLTERRTIVIVPGITGVELVDPTTGNVVWGRGANLIAPRDHGYRLALALDGGKSTDNSSVPGRALEEIRLGPIVKPVYGPIVALFESHGWHRGDLDEPSASDDLFLFAYDWRLDNVGSAHRLAAALEALAEQTGRAEQPVTLVCQSNGAHICRYLAKYGKASLEAAERGVNDPPVGVYIEQLVLVGNANGGSLRILRYLNRGRRYVRGIGREFAPEVFFTFESLYQDLPAYRTDLFVAPDGRPLEIDLYDPASWRRHGWSIYGKAPRRRLGDAKQSELFADTVRRDEHLARQLAAARRFQAVLKADAPVGRTRYYLIQNRDIPTPERALLRQTDDGWETLITGDRQLRRLDIFDSVTAAGDGHATAASQLWLAPAEVAAFGAPPDYVDGAHFEMILERPTLDRLLEIVGGD